MSEEKAIFEQKIRINTFECDFTQHWKPASFFQHLSEAAGLHAAMLGVGYEAMLAQNLYWVHARMKIKFHQFPSAGDHITIRTWPKTIQQKLFFIRDFEVLDIRGNLLAAASSAWLVVNAATRRMALPQSVEIKLPHLANKVGLEEPLEKLDVIQNYIERLQARAGYSAVDILGHVNNSRYIEWICDSFPMDMYQHKTLDWMQINYEREVRPGDVLSLKVGEVETEKDLWMIQGMNLSNKVRAFESALKWKEKNNNSSAGLPDLKTYSEDLSKFSTM